MINGLRVSVIQISASHITLKRVRAITVAVGKLQVLHILRVCV